MALLLCGAERCWQARTFDTASKDVGNQARTTQQDTQHVAAAGLDYYNPHSFRDMLVRYGQSLNLTVEEFKAWSQNLGHAAIMTTLNSYGSVPTHRQGELIHAAGVVRGSTVDPDAVILARALLAKVG